MLTQSEGQQALLLTVDTDEQCDQQADSATIHVFQSAEVQDNIAGRGGTRLRIGVHQHLFSKSGDLTLDVDDTGRGCYPASVHHDPGLWHRFTPFLSSDFARYATMVRQR